MEIKGSVSPVIESVTVPVKVSAHADELPSKQKRRII
jgi:hypothetical protein